MVTLSEVQHTAERLRHNMAQRLIPQRIAGLNRRFLIPSRQYLLNDVAMHVGQTHVAAAEAERLAGVIDTQQVQHRGVEVVHF